MEILGVPLHEALAIAAAVCAPVGCLVSLWYAFRPESRDAWRYPMIITATVATATILAAFISGDRMLTNHPQLSSDPQVGAHQEYAARLVLPTIGYFVMAALTGWLNPRTGALRLALPMLLTGFSVVVLALVVLSGDADARSLWDDVSARF
jgi:hypothetical protein